MTSGSAKEQQGRMVCMQKCVCEWEEKEVCVRAGGGQRGRGWLFQEVIAANQLSQQIYRRITA